MNMPISVANKVLRASLDELVKQVNERIKGDNTPTDQVVILETGDFKGEKALEMLLGYLGSPNWPQSHKTLPPKESIDYAKELIRAVARENYYPKRIGLILEPHNDNLFVGYPSPQYDKISMFFGRVAFYLVNGSGFHQPAIAQTVIDLASQNKPKKAGDCAAVACLSFSPQEFEQLMADNFPKGDSTESVTAVLGKEAASKILHYQSMGLLYSR